MIVYLSSLRGMAQAEAERRARAWLERFDLAGRARDRVDALSKGNQQKVQLITALLLHRGREVMGGTLAAVRASSGVARRVRVTLAAPARPDDLAALAPARVEARDGGRLLDIDLPEGHSVGSLLHALTARCEVLDVHSEAPSLRELYLRAVGVDPEAADDAMAGAADGRASEPGTDGPGRAVTP